MPFVPPHVYRHDQASASDTWVIAHNLGHNGGQGIPVVDTYVNSGGDLQKILPLSVDMTDENTVTITFTEPYDGYAVIVV